MLNSLLQVWRRHRAEAHAVDVQDSEQPEQDGRHSRWPLTVRPLSRSLRPCFNVLLVCQACLTFIRWHIGDPHGALLMFVIFLVGVVTVIVDRNSLDIVYGGYFGLMAFVSGLLDMNVAIEKIVWNQWHHVALSTGDFSGLAKPLVYVACSLTQLVAAFVVYVLYKDAEDFEEAEDMPLFATPEQAMIYNAVLHHSERRLPVSSNSPKLKPFNGSAQKLP
mmetsp:Transcript_49410/g.78182  ORF Transcript_49410/g.78182 Transcript_49410/m.78182 type:complete len:220 (+) Transcript_49410:123-782(+)|eukprot:CAMPEP_0169105058 /NCGR_PEP_ID=MMETSP1015-20121227/23588_1 /TAXON_ID=342587 /ORGANISM="Karlodinium micrum, Strain CCMP2283" /LENGTH=219 /DNA_ID=CAMNT_0009166381 /DNA_START=122 /DNA_END=781 /DNA_ORIENTATION=+